MGDGSTKIMRIGIFSFIVCLLVPVTVLGQSDGSCDTALFRQCFDDLVTTVLSAAEKDTSRSVCSQTDFDTNLECTSTQLNNCASHFGDVMVSTVRPYVRLFENVYQKACSEEYEFGECNLETAKTCIGEFFHILSYGGVTKTCKQAVLTRDCMQPVLDSCSDLPRYLVATLKDEIQLTSDLLCHPNSCNLDIAAQLLREAMILIDYPVNIVRQSSLVCSELMATLALVTNQTAECSQNDIPTNMLQVYWHLYQFGTDYCEIKADHYMLTNVPTDLLLPVYLAAIGSSQWSSPDDICKLFNATMLVAADHLQYMGTDYQNTWKNAIKLTLDKYSKMCLRQLMFDCDWVDRVKISGDCDLEKAESCLDIGLLRTLVVMVNIHVKGVSWQSVCAAAYSMLACNQYHINTCGLPASPHMDMIQEIENLVGYECGQLGQFDRPDSCDNPETVCDIEGAMSQCGELAQSKDDVCQHKDEVFSCYRQHTASCTSVEESLAQFNMEWLLNGCTFNFTLIREDSLRGLSECALRFGYNLYNGMIQSSDFSWVICASGSLYEQCLADISVPALANLYNDQHSDFNDYMQTVCNMTGMNTNPLPSDFQETADCDVNALAGEATRATMGMSASPLSSWEAQYDRCRNLGTVIETLRDSTSSCSPERQILFTGAIGFLSDMHSAFCPKTKPNEGSSCDIAWTQTCLEDFGTFVYFANSGSDTCGKLQETYICLYEHARHCDNATQDELVKDVQAIRGLLGGEPCDNPGWCTQPEVGSPLIREICQPQEECLLNDWQSCVDQFGINRFCSNDTEVVSCVQDKLSGCDPIQYIVAQRDIIRYTNSFASMGMCFFSFTDPGTVTPEHYDFQQCLGVFGSNGVFKDSICTSLNQYLQCVSDVEQTSISYVWKAMFKTSAQMWMKEYYLWCQQTGDNFIISPELNRDDFTGTECSSDGIPCLVSLFESAVATSIVVPLSQRETVCNSAETDFECVVNQTAGCTIAEERGLLTSGLWLLEAVDNVGTCSGTTAMPRTCDQEAAMGCIADLGLDMARAIYTQSKTLLCMKALPAQICVNKHTSSCDFDARSKIEKLFAKVSTIVRNYCTAPPVTHTDMCTIQQGNPQCNVERALVCLVPTQAKMMTGEGMEAVCGTIPMLKTCVQMFTSGCDEATQTMMKKRLWKLSANLNHQCPQMFCEECQARNCIWKRYQTLQNEDVHICSAISDMEQCIVSNAQYCDESVKASLQLEVEQRVGEDKQLCEVTLPACLQKFMESAFQIMSYTPGAGMSGDFQNQTGPMAAYQPDLIHACDQANKAFYCVKHHFDTTPQKPILTMTLEGIGDQVYQKCQGRQLQCYSCANATSNEECNSQPMQTCAANMQACGTMVTDGAYLSKGCVSPDICQTGCYGSTCSFCCQDDYCNQPWNNVLSDPSTCQPLSALYCGFQLLFTSTQNSSNQTDSCSSLQQSISCMMDNTQSCHSHHSMAMGSLGRQLLASDAVGSCVSRNPMCECGQCTALLLMTLVSSPSTDQDKSCNAARKLYKQTLGEMDFLVCERETIHLTAGYLNMATYMLQGVCSLKQEDSECKYKNRTYPHGSSFDAEDGCNMCNCSMGKVACTLRICPPPDDTKCYYNDETYDRGETFSSDDGCNLCLCDETQVSCTNNTCRDNFNSTATCDESAVSQCIDGAYSIYEIIRLGIPVGLDWCSAAAEMLDCIDPIMPTCPPDVQENIREQITTNLDEVPQDQCDIEDILRLYTNITGGQNMTQGRCSIDRSLQCFNVTSQNDTCGMYQSIQDCVSDQTADCLDMNMGPVLFTLERSLEILAEDCDIVTPTPGPGPTPTPTPDPNEPPNRDYCSHGNKTFSTGTTFRSVDMCNFCYCNMGEVICTSLNCPYQGDTRTCNMTGVEQCIQDTYMAYMVSMAAQDGGLQICMSAVEMLRCIDPQITTCSQNNLMTVQNIVRSIMNQVSSVCSIEQILMAYNQNVTQPGSGDSRCTMQGAMNCLSGIGRGQDICSDQQQSLECLYNMTQACYSANMMPALSSLLNFFESSSGCDLNMPPKQDVGICVYDGVVYYNGDNFMADDGCNLCFCGSNGVVGCTKMYCGDASDTCDITEVRQCIEKAAIPTLLSTATQETGHICLSAAEMLRCIEPKISACNNDALLVIKMAVWSNLNMIQPICDVNQLYWLYNNTDMGNHTTPDTSKQCSLQDALQCIRITDGHTACSAYQAMIDCVSEFTVGCLSVDAVPVLYELHLRLAPASAICDLVVPMMHFDAAFPVAQCSLMFANAVGYEINFVYLRTGQLDGICSELEGYVTCLRTADLSTLGRMYASNAIQSVANIVRLCEEYKEKQEPERVECHRCDGFTSMEACDSQPLQTCQQNQVCSTGLQLDPNTGMTYIFKGCADFDWCQASSGCDRQSMSCIHCCWGSECNTADNTTTYTTTAAPPMTTRPARATTTKEMETCDLQKVAIYMTSHIIRLVNFNFIPLKQREPICQNFEQGLSDLVDDLRCLASTNDRVENIAEWLTEWSSTTCKQSEENPIDENKCYDSLNCLDNFGNFTDKMSTCRMLNRSISCLRTNSEFCINSMKDSINRSVQLLVNMDHLICVANPLDKLEEPECVDLQSFNNRSTCDESEVMGNAEYIKKAYYNPFVETGDLCSMIKVGMKRIKDNTYNCSNEVYNRVSRVAANVIQVAYQRCPNTWCPASEHCKLDKARHCLDYMEGHVEQMMNNGYLDMASCLSVSEIHHCVMNATEECYALDRQSVVQRFNSLAQKIVPQCQAQATDTLQCYQGFTQGVDTLSNFDGIVVSSIVDQVVQQFVTSQLFGNYTMSFGGVNLPDPLVRKRRSIGEWQNPYIRRRRGVPEPTNNIFGNGGNTTSGGNAGNTTSDGNASNTTSGRRNETNNNPPGTDVWKDNSTVPGNGTNMQRPNGTGTNSTRPVNGSLPTDPAPEMAQGGMTSDAMSELFRLILGQGTYSEYIDTLISMVGLNREQLTMLIDPHTLVKIGGHKVELCDHIYEAYQCLQFNMQMMMLPGKQQYMMATALELLSGAAMEMCNAQQCHSCYGLESNELCNRQPVATCQPLQVCQARTMGDYISKGCESILTCEEKCQHGGRNGTCYCCRGSMCNKRTELPQGTCDIQTATGCVQSLLNMAVTGRDPWENLTLVYKTAMCMVMSTSGCDSEAYKKIHSTGRHMLALFEAVNCSASYDRAFCNIPGAATLAALVANPHRTIISTDMTCSMFESVLEIVMKDRANSSCCKDAVQVRLALLSIYNKLEPFCPGLDIEPVCNDHRTRGCDGSSHGEIVERICELSKLPEDRNSSGRCDTTGAVEQCFPALTTDPRSFCPSPDDLDSTRFCLNQFTEGCDETEAGNMFAVLRNLALLCPLEEETTDDEAGKDDDVMELSNSVVTCLKPLAHVGEVLSNSEDVHTELCQDVDRVIGCLENTQSMLGLMRVLELLDVMGNLKHTFCDKDKDMEDKDDEPKCDSEIVKCVTNPCDNVNITTACPAFPNAVCIPDYCGGCNTKFAFRGKDVSDMCQDTTAVSSCDVEGNSTAVSYYLNIMVLSRVMVWYETDLLCSQDILRLDSESLSECPAVYAEPIEAMLSWLQDQVDMVCYTHVANYPCLNPHCDVSMATELIDSLGYYLRTKTIKEIVFCKKVENVLRALECVVEPCDNATAAPVELMMMDIKPLLHSRCPHLMEEIFCDTKSGGPDIGLCFYDDVVYYLGSTFNAIDGCNKCSCGRNGIVSCTEESCGDIGLCVYNGVVYYLGNTFKDIDGCNDCSCGRDGLVSCTEKACIDTNRSSTPPPATMTTRMFTTPGIRRTTQPPATTTTGRVTTTGIRGTAQPPATTTTGRVTTTGIRGTTRPPASATTPGNRGTQQRVTTAQPNRERTTHGQQGTTTSRPSGSGSGGTTAAPPTSRPGCALQKAELCIYTVGMPSQNGNLSSEYCSDLLEAVVRLSECIAPLSTDCNDQELAEIDRFYHGVMARYQRGCSVNMIRQLMIRLEAGDCFVPECSYYETHDCSLNLHADGDICGNLEDVTNCVELASAGCSDSQRYINEGMLWVGAVIMLPEQCWPEPTSVNTSKHAVLQCVDNMGETLAEHLAGNITGPSQVCLVLGTLLDCLEASYDDVTVPAPLSQALAQLVEMAVPVLHMVCDSIDVGDVTTVNGDSSSCLVDDALAMLRGHAVDALLTPIMTQDGKEYVCSYDSEPEKSWRRGFEYFIGTCSPEKQQDLMMVFNMVDMFGRQTGTCVSQPSMCAPGDAMQIIQTLAYKVEQHGNWQTDQADICRSIDDTRKCLRQTTGTCEDYVHKSLMASLEPIMCKALAICPSMMEEKEQNTTMTDLPVCISPTGTAATRQNGMCDTNKAVSCLQSLHAYVENHDDSDKKMACGKYVESMECLMENLNGCDNATIKYGLSYGLRAAKYFGDKCPTQVKAFCNNKSRPGCDPTQIYRCFDIVKAATGTGMEDMCFAKEHMRQCLEKNAGSCPRQTQLFIHTELLMHMSEKKQNEQPDCDSTKQCAFNYLTYLTQTFDQLVEARREEEEAVCPQEKEMDEVYECRAREKEVECMMNNKDKLPDDVAAVVDATLQYVDTLFTTVCNATSGMGEELQTCDSQCLHCYREEIDLHSYLPLLLSIESETTMDDGTEGEIYDEFCSEYAEWRSEVTEYEAESSCYGDHVTDEWHDAYVDAIDELYDKYCDRPCNTTQADLCIATFQNNTGDEPCLAYEEVLGCLNASIFYCPSNTTDYYDASVVAVLINEGFRCYQMPTFTATYETSTLVEGVPWALSITMLEELEDECIGETCLIQISLTFDDPNVTSCREGIKQILTDKCIISFVHNESSQTDSFNLFSVIDHTIQPDRNVTISITAKIIEDGEQFIEMPVEQVIIQLKNRDTSALCVFAGESFLQPFDGGPYMVVNKGEYVLYVHTEMPQMVTVRLQPCRRNDRWSTCVCSTMIQSGDDVYVFDVCRGGNSQPSFTFTIYRNGDYSPFTTVHYDFSGDSYQVILSTGTIIEVQLALFSGEENLLVSINPSALDWNSTLGLCGNYDDISDYDFIYPDGSVQNASDFALYEGAPFAFLFVRAWSFDGTLLYGVSEAPDHLTRNNTLCRCTGDSDICESTNLVETCDFVSGTLFDEGSLTVFEDIPTTADRRRRQAEDDDVIVVVSELPTWPTASNITLEMAQEHCNSVITSTQFWEVCNLILDTASIVSTCTDKILLADNYDAVQTTLETLRILCRTSAISDPSLSIPTNMTYDVLVPYILNRTCLAGCNGNGQCGNGICVCNDGYTGDDCSIMVTMAPILSSVSENLYTASSASGNTGVTRTVDIYGGSFANSDNLTCHMEEVEFDNTTSGYTPTGVSTSQHAFFLTVGSVRCEVTGSLPLTGMLISVSNNGQNQSNPVLYIIQDEVCYNCNATSGRCNRLPTGCVIDNVCYSAVDPNPADNCYLCDPFVNDWKYKPSSYGDPSCPGTSTTTTTTPVSVTSTTTTTTTPSVSVNQTTTTPNQTTSTTPSVSVSSTTTTTTSTTTSQTTSTTPTVSETTATPSRTTATSSVSVTQTTSETNTDGQSGDDENEDDRTVLIIVISVSGVMALVIIAAVVCIACRMKQRDSRNRDLSFATSQSSTDMGKARPGGSHLQGRLNPSFKEVEYATAHGIDQPVVPRRGAPSRSAPFYPQGLQQEYSGAAGAAYDMNIGMFEQGRPTENPNKPTHTWEEVGFKIPRPGVDVMYDNTKLRGPTGSMRKTDPNFSYEMGQFTHL